MIKVLWITNIVMPKLAKYINCDENASGSWLIDIAELLAKSSQVQLTIVSVFGKEFKKFEHVDGITYYLLPGTGKNMLFYTRAYEKLWPTIISEIDPDIIHIHGTEYTHGLSFLRTFPQKRRQTIISIQGILERVKDVDLGEISPWVYIKNRTFRQFLLFNGELEIHLLHKLGARYEKEMLNYVNYINAVNTWDSSLCRSINPALRVYRIEYNLRKEFYDAQKWNIGNCKRLKIFTNPGGTPLKGLHQLILAGSLIKNKYPEMKIIVPGMGIHGELIINNSYSKYIKKLILKHEMVPHIEFMGRMSASEMRDQMLDSNVVVIPSAIEGTSLVLREAMYLGCPCIASFRGGMADFINDKYDGFLYDFQEYPVLASRIESLFNNDVLCNEFSKNAQMKASIAHDRNKNVNDYLEMYNEIFLESRSSQ